MWWLQPQSKVHCWKDQWQNSVFKLIFLHSVYEKQRQLQVYNKGCGVILILHQRLPKPLFFSNWTGGIGVNLCNLWITIPWSNETVIHFCFFKTGSDVVPECFFLFYWNETKLRGNKKVVSHSQRGERHRNRQEASPTCYQTAPQVINSVSFCYLTFISRCWVRCILPFYCQRIKPEYGSIKGNWASLRIFTVSEYHANQRSNSKEGINNKVTYFNTTVALGYARRP